ncbi:MAG TPA: DNA-binding protein, partial [Candidatus Atribacteria bacterium]|nr:DNA-binding protein [Candidatus Atribacteria bacterium]
MVVEAKVGRIIVERLTSGKDLLEEIKRVVKEANVKSGFLLAIGALSKAVFGYYEEEKREYKKIEINELLEILSCIGNISEAEGEEKIIHAHITVGNSKGEAYGGHILPGCIIGPTVELI